MAAVITTSDTPKVEGVTGTVGTITTPDGKKQVTVNGMPVYLWEKDKAPGDVKGQGVGNVWYLVAPDGTMINSRPAILAAGACPRAPALPSEHDNYTRPEVRREDVADHGGQQSGVADAEVRA